MARILGAHTIDNGGIHMAALRAGKGNMSALQIFTAIPKYYGDKVSIRPERVERFRAALATTRIAPENVIVHSPYVLNVASADAEKWQRASDGLRKELERSTALGVGQVCFHPGAASGAADRPAALKRVGKAITAALEAVTGQTRLLIENTAGAGQTVGRHAEEIAGMLAVVPKKLRPRTGYGLDSCHLYASGHDITKSRAAFAAILDEFESATGEPPSFFHLNDSEGELGSNRDRHALIGDGHIGTEPFSWLMQDRRSAGVPLVLETPQENFDIADDDPSPDAYDVKMMKLLRAFEP
ncbi:MAG: deoxyribonuclease IV [Gemmatimonadaceae bacterium]